MRRQALIVGGGIGGLTAALSAARADWQVRLYERAPAFSEVGAGVQLGPNVVRVLHGWGLQDALARVAAFPHRLQVRDAVSGRELGVLALGDRALQKYGAPYATIYRADLQDLLLHAVQAQGNVQLNLNTSATGYSDSGHAVRLQTTQGPDACERELEGDALIGADGLWSRVRKVMLNDAPPRLTGHLAYRSMVLQSDLPERLRSQQVTAWLGPKLHVVQYPVRGTDWLNVVAIVHGEASGGAQSWDHAANGADLAAAMSGACLPLRNLIEAVPHWRLWLLQDRPPMQGAHQHALGRVALLGDAAHPMRPYLAQGAAMALEDAAELGEVLALARKPGLQVESLLQRYAENRWRRNARVQAKALRNGQVFHAHGLLRMARNASLKLLGEKLLDLPWLYGTTSNRA